MDAGGMKGDGRGTGSSPVNRTINVTILRPLVVLAFGLIGHAIGYSNSKSYSHQEMYGNGPSFVRPVGNQTAAIGREAVFSCYVRNIGKYKVGWLKTSDQTVLSLNTRIVTHNTRIAVSYETGGCSSTPGIPMGIHGMAGSNQVTDEGVNCTWRLHIRHLKETDRGCYMCQINTSPMKSELGCLDILVPPDIVYGDETSKDLSVSEGENVTLNCQATGIPKPRVSWKREDGQHILIRNSTSISNRKNMHFHPVEVYNDTKLHFYRVDRQQMGVYMCIAANDVPPSVSKRVTLEVNFAPVVEAPTQLLGGPVGKRITLECTVEAHPNTINYWTLNETGMLLEGPKYEIRETKSKSGYKVKMTLVIKKFTQQDPGNYKCIATNSLGKGESSIRLYDLKLQDDVSIIGGLAEAARGSSIAANSRPSKLIYAGLSVILILLRVTCSR